MRKLFGKMIKAFKKLKASFTKKKTLFKEIEKEFLREEEVLKQAYHGNDPDKLKLAEIIPSLDYNSCTSFRLDYVKGSEDDSVRNRTNMHFSFQRYCKHFIESAMKTPSPPIGTFKVAMAFLKSDLLYKNPYLEKIFCSAVGDKSPNKENCAAIACGILRGNTDDETFRNMDSYYEMLESTEAKYSYDLFLDENGYTSNLLKHALDPEKSNKEIINIAVSLLSSKRNIEGLRQSYRDKIFKSAMNMDDTNKGLYVDIAKKIIKEEIDVTSILYNKEHGPFGNISPVIPNI